MTLPYLPPYMPPVPPALPMNQYYQSHVPPPLLDPLQYQRSMHPMPYQPSHDTYYPPPQGYGAVPYLPMFHPPVTQSSLGPPPSMSYQANQMHFSHLPRMIYPSLSVPTQQQYVPVTQSSQSYLSQLRSAAERTAASNAVGPSPINGLGQEKSMPTSRVAEKTRTSPEVIVIQDDPIAPTSTPTPINPILDLRSKPFDFSLTHNPSVGQQYTFGNGYKPGPGQQYISKIRAMVEGIQGEDLSKNKKPKLNCMADSKSPDMYSGYSPLAGKSNGTFGSKPVDVAFTPFYRDHTHLSNEKPQDNCGSFITHTPYAKTTSDDQSRSTVLHTPFTNTISEEQYRHPGYFAYPPSLEENHKQQTPDSGIDLLESDAKTQGQMESRIPADCSQHLISYESKKRRNSGEMWSSPASESLKEKKPRPEDEDQSRMPDNRLSEKLEDYQPFSKRKLRAHWFPRPISSNEEYLFIGPNGTVVPSKIYATIPWENEENCTRILMESVFDDDTLSSQSLQGIYPLDPAKVEDVVTHVSDKCLVKEECVRSKILQLCAEKALKRMGCA